MTHKELNQMLLALRIAFIGALIVLLIATVVMDIITAFTCLAVIVTIAVAYPLIKKEIK